MLTASTADATPAAAPPDALTLLDDEAEWRAFSRPDPKAPGCWQSNVLIEGMHCAACALNVEDAMRRVPGVDTVQVSASSRRARVVWRADAVKPSGWMSALRGTGYAALPANDAFARERRRAESRLALWRMMVAGLSMMQVMMYAFPAYVAAPGDLAMEYEQLLRWASWVLSLPVITFSCAPFFRNAWRDVIRRQVSMDLPVALGMAITFGVSTAGTFDPSGLFGREVYFDSLTMFVFFLWVGRWFELKLRDRTAGALESLMNRLPDAVARERADGTLEWVAARRLAVGDVLQVRAGEAFVADALVLQGQTSADEALLTGESRPVPKAPGDEVIAGSHNLSTLVRVRVLRLGEQTRFAQIVALMESAATSKPSLARLADRVARPFLLVVLLASALACAYWWPSNPEHALMVAVSVLVVTCPCALSLATPAAMLAAAGQLATRGVLVRRLDALETLASVDGLFFDKTGTLTRDALVLADVRHAERVRREQALGWAALLGRESLHPVARALADARVSGSVRAVQEFAGLGLEGRVRWAGTPEHFVRLGSAAFCQLDPAAYPQTVHLCDEQGWLASFDLQEDVRADAAAAVAALQAQGVAVEMLSGDRAEAAQRVALAVGIANANAGCTPADKLDVLRQRQAQGHCLAVVGDGLNDGPVLAGAHVSFAFGQAVPLAQSKADFLVSGGRLMAVSEALHLARRTLAVVRQNLWWAALYNAVCIPLAVVGLLPAWLAGLGMASSSLLVVLNALRLSRPAH